MASIHQRQNEDLNRCHLRRIGCKPTVAGVADLIHFYKDVTLFGRNKDVVDYYISSPGETKDCISRHHARVIRTADTYELVDSSLTGVYVNDIKIGGKVILQKGDTVIFGHPTERYVKPGTQVRQPNSQLCFLFEHCCCRIDQWQNACDEMRNFIPQIPLLPLTSPEVPQFSSNLVFEKSVSLPAQPPSTQTPRDTPRNVGALSESSMCSGGREASTVTVSLPFSSVGSIKFSAKSSVSTNFTTVTSARFEKQGTCKSTAISDTTLKGCTTLEPLLLRSASPEYEVMSRNSAVTAESVQQAAFLPQENVSSKTKLINPDLLPMEQSEGQTYASRSIPESYKLFLEEKRDSEGVEMEPYSAASPNEEPVIPRDIVRADDCHPCSRELVSLSVGMLALSDSSQPGCQGQRVPRLLEPVADKSVLQSCEGSDSELVVMETDVDECTDEMVRYETAETSGLGTQVMNLLEATKEDTNNVPLVSSYKEKTTEKESPVEHHRETSEERHKPDVCARDASCETTFFTEIEMYEYYPKKKKCSSVNSSTESVTDIKNNSENGDPIKRTRGLEGQHATVKQIENQKNPVRSGIKTAAAEEELLSETTEALSIRVQDTSVQLEPEMKLLYSETKSDLTSTLKEKSISPNEMEKQVSCNIVESDTYPLAERELGLGMINSSPNIKTQQPGTTSDPCESAEANHDKIIMVVNTGCGEETCNNRVFDLQNAFHQNLLFADTEGIKPVNQDCSHAQNTPAKYAAKAVSLYESQMVPVKSTVDDADALLLQSCAAGNVDTGASQMVISDGETRAVISSEDEEIAVDSHVAEDRLVVKSTVDATVPDTHLSSQCISDSVVHLSSANQVSSGGVVCDSLYKHVSCFGCLHSENPSGHPVLKEGGPYHSGALVRPSRGVNATAQEQQGRVVSQVGVSGEEGGDVVRTSVGETENHGAPAQPESLRGCNACDTLRCCQAAVSVPAAPNASVCTESECVQSRSAHLISPLSKGEMPREAGSDFNKTKHLQVGASQEEMEETNVIILAWDGEGKCEDKDNSEAGMEVDISPVVDDIEVSHTEVGTETRFIKKRKTNSVSAKLLEDGNKDRSTKHNYYEEDETNVPMDTNMPSSRTVDVHVETIHDGANDSALKEFSEEMEMSPAGSAQTAEKELFSGLETCERETISVALCSPIKGIFLENPGEKLLAVTNSDSSLNLGGEIPNDLQLQDNGCIEEKEGSLKENQSLLYTAEKENTDTNQSLKAFEISVVCSVDSTFDNGSDRRLNAADGQEQRAACSSEDDVLSEEKHDDLSGSIERKSYQETKEDVESKNTTRMTGERRASRPTINDSMSEQQNDQENEDLARDWGNAAVQQALRNFGSTTAALAERPEQITDCCSSDLVSFPSSLVPVGSPRWCEGDGCSSLHTEPSRPVDERGVGSGLQHAHACSLVQLCSESEEGDGGEEGSEPAHHEQCDKSVVEKGSEEPADFSEPDERKQSSSQDCDWKSPVSSVCSELQEQSVELEDQQESDSCAIEPPNLGRNVDLKSKEDCTKPSLYPEGSGVEDAVLDEVDRENMNGEGLTTTNWEGSNGSAICQDGCGIKPQAPQIGVKPCSMGQEDFSAGMCNTVIEKFESSRENRTEDLKEIERDPTDVAEFCSRRESHLCIQDLEAEKGENNGIRAKMFPVNCISETDVWKEGDIVTRDADGGSGSVVLCSELHCNRTESEPDKVTETAAIRSTARIEKSVDVCLEQVSCPHFGTERDLAEVKMTASDCHSTGIAADEKIMLLVKDTPLGGEKETPTTEECESVSLYRAFNSVGFPGVPEEVEAASCEACSSELEGNTDSNPFQTGKELEEGRQAEIVLLGDHVQEQDSEVPTVPSEVMRTVKDSPVSEIKTELCPEKNESDWETQIGKPLLLQEESQETEPMKAQTKICQPESSREELSILESRFANRMDCCEEEDTNAQNKESKRESSSRKLKRQVTGNECFGASDSEDEQFSQKRHCPLGSLSVPESVCALPGVTIAIPPATRGLQEHHATSVRDIVRQFFKKYPTAQTFEETEKENNQSYVAQLVRDFFKNASDCDNLVNADVTETFLPPREDEVAGHPSGSAVSALGISGSLERRDSCSSALPEPVSQAGGCQSAACASGWTGCSSARQFVCTEPAASSPASPSDVMEKDASEAPASPSADSVSDEEQFQSNLCSALDNKCASESSLVSPSEYSVQSTKSLSFVFSDLSNTSTEEKFCQTHQEIGDAALTDMSTGEVCERACCDNCEASETRTLSGSAVCSPEATTECWTDGDANMTSYHDVTSRENEPSMTNMVQQPKPEDGDEGFRYETDASILHPCERSPPSNEMSNREDSVPSPSPPPPFKQTDSRHGVPLTWGSDLWAEGLAASDVTANTGSQVCLERRLSTKEHSDGNRRGIFPPSETCLASTACPSEPENEELSHERASSPFSPAPCASSQTSPAEQAFPQTPLGPRMKQRLPLKKMKNTHSSILSSASPMSSPSAGVVDNKAKSFQSSCLSTQEDLSSSVLSPENCNSTEVAHSVGGGGDPWEGPYKDDQGRDAKARQQKQDQETSVCDCPDGRVTPRPCAPVEAGDSSDLQTVNDLGNQKILASNFCTSGDKDFPRAVSDSLPPAHFPISSFKEENVPYPLQPPALLDAFNPLGMDSKERLFVHSALAPTLYASDAAEVSTCSLTTSFQLHTKLDSADMQTEDEILLPKKSEALKYSPTTLGCVSSPKLEDACDSKDPDDRMQNLLSVSVESTKAYDLSSASRNSGNLSGGESSNLKASFSDRAESESWRDWALSEGDIEFQLQRCQAVLRDISQVLHAVEGIDGEHMEEWREQIDKLQKNAKMPKTYIAVVGNTGAGKSSLLNALLGEEAVLPTSAMRACTAVVVEISKTAETSPYEADVEFLSKEEWFSELKALLEDMKDKSGNLKKRCPDRKTEAGVAYSRVKAVYGMVAELSKLEELQEVTQHLGTVKHISAVTATDFRTKIEKFIDSRTDNLRDMKGGEFWPIVKCVKIRVPKADVLKTGAVLVDLPGIRDSNAARDNAAKEYLKNCDAVWVVANINRAVDDKTAKEMLNINLRRQLLMDGQYGRLAFVCTKTDAFNISEIISDLDLKDEIEPIERELEDLENQRVQMELEKESLYAELQQEPGQGPHAGNSASFQKENELRKMILEKEFKINALLREKEAKLRAISLICVQSRNKYSKERIWLDFINGLQEMKRKAALAECEEDEYEEEMEDEELNTLYASDLGEAGFQHNKLQVFTVSSTEYLKLHGKLLREGQPQVFHNDEDTEIPALKKFAVHAALQHGMVETEKLIRDMTRIISQVVNYLTNQRAEDHSQRAQAQEIIQTCLLQVPELLQEAVDDSVHEIQYCFSVLLLSHLKRGARKAEDVCEEKVRSWGLPHCGYPYATYRAVCARQGVYSSVACGFIDFNEQLTEPIYSTISMTWNEVFSSKLSESVRQFSKAVLDKLKQFFKDLKNKLYEKGGNTYSVNHIQRQQMEAAQALLCNFILDQIDYINKRQRGISRVLTPEIQASMKPVYTVCNQVNGPGSFQRMKDLMQDYIHEHKQSMFSTATYKLQQQLELLQQYICASFEWLVQNLNKSLTRQFEPILKTVQKNDSIVPDLVSICAKVHQICKLSFVDYVLPNPSQIGACSRSASPEKELQEGREPPDFVGKCSVVRIGTLPLIHVASVQISVQEITISFRGHASLTVPFSSVYLCECCFHLYYLNLHVSPEGAKDIYARLGARAPKANLGNEEVLVVLETPEDPGSFRRLIEFISEKHSGTPWFRELSLQRGREKLESLQVYYTAGESKYGHGEELPEIPASSLPEDLPAVGSTACQPLTVGPWSHANSRKRGGGGEILSQPEKKHKGSAVEKSPEVKPAENLLLSQQIPGSLEISAKSTLPGEAVSASRACLQGCYQWTAASFQGTSSSKAEVKRETDPFLILSSAVTADVSHVPGEEGAWRTWQPPEPPGGSSSGTDAKETSGNAHPARGFWAAR
ncbi:uncharacterized protein LOC112991949 isoform X2 [Dromaius novaehollandiae]|uniref:uncharacterized protein LOC112991949 isoform X2 n=1 Tax=Dromaius novaehollandiae TaxID=8790 RepID=UPI00311D7605